MIETDRARVYMLAAVFVPCSDPFVLFDKLHMRWYCGICWRTYITARCRLGDVHCFLRIFESLYASFAESAPNPWIFMVPPCSSQVWASMCILFSDELGHHCLVQDGFHVYLSSVKSQIEQTDANCIFQLQTCEHVFNLFSFFHQIGEDWRRWTLRAPSSYKTWTPEITLLIVPAVLSLPVHIILPLLFVTGSVMKPFCGKDMQELRMHELWWIAHKSTRVCFEYLLSAFDSVCFNCAFFSRHRCTISSLGLTWKRWSMGAHWTAQASIPTCPQPAWHSWD